jgi:hypothetical protein
MSDNDTKFVAAMNVHGVWKIVTFNIGDFVCYEGMAPENPAFLLS